MKGTVEVLEPGMLTTIQDAGRPGYRKYGVPVSGALDEHASRLANWLVGNTENTPVIELTLQGGSFKFLSEAVIGISGAEADVKVNEAPVRTNETIQITSGDVLNIGKVRSGCRVYLAIAGRWVVEDILGSRSTCLTANFGGYEGRKLKKGDRIRWTQPQQDLPAQSVPKKLLPHFSTHQTIRIIKGPEWDQLNKDQKDQFLSTGFGISSQSNRMGIRLEGSFNIEKDALEEMVSSPVIPGIIQLPKGGSPIILMKDAQSVGGYPRIAKVVDADLWRLGQVWVRNEINFSLISLREAKQLHKYHQDTLSKLA